MKQTLPWAVGVAGCEGMVVALGLLVRLGEAASVGLALGLEAVQAAVNPPAMTQATIRRTALPKSEAPILPPTRDPPL